MELLVAGERGGEGEEGGEVGALAFVADAQAAVAEEPGDGAFDLPAVPAEAFLSVLDIDSSGGDGK